MSLLMFPDKILLDIFDYFYFTEIIYSFYDLMRHNNRLYNLIHAHLHSIYLSKVDLRFMTKSQFRFVCRSIRSNEKFLDKIHSLILSNQYTFGQIRVFLSQISFDDMVNLKKLHLIQPTYDEYHIIFPTKLSQLTHLVLEYPECDDNNRIVLIDEMNELIELKIISNYSVQFRSEYLRLENLILNQLNFIDLIGFSTFFPNLHYLDITLIHTDIDLNQIHLPLLTVLKLRSYNVEHIVCEKFLLNLLLLRELYYSNNVYCTKTFIVDGYRCQSLTERLPLLEQFAINIHLFNTYSTDICELAASFQTEYYRSKNWNIICESRSNSNDFHIYSIPMPLESELTTTTDNLISSTLLPIDDSYINVKYLKLNMTSNWPLIPRFFPNIHSLELTYLNPSKVIPTLSILSYLNKSMFLSNIRKLILPSPCHFDDLFLSYLLQQSALNIYNLDISCHYLIRLIKTKILQSPLPIRILTLRDDYLLLDDRNSFIEVFKFNLNCLSLYLPNNNSLIETIQLFLDQFQFLYSLDVLIKGPMSIFIHLELYQMIRQRSDTSAELRPTNIRIWDK